MLGYLKLSVLILGALFMQFTILPVYLADPFKPNLLLIVVVFLGLREPGVWGGVLVAILGLLTDTFSGLYLGLTLFSYLSIYLILRKAAVHLYTESGYLFVTVVFFATILSGLFEMSLLLLFYVAGGGYKILSVMPTQALVNAMVASLVTFLMPSTTSPEVKP